MDVIGNNIANVNTYGFKASRTTFSDVYYQSLQGGSRGTEGGVRGGTNPTQIGYGSSVATIDIMITQSGSASTDRALDVYIGGDGFITVKDPSGKTYYTRLGNLAFDEAGNLVDGNGNVVQGFKMIDDGEGGVRPDIPPNGEALESDLAGIYVSRAILDELTGISISASGQIVGILPGKTEMKVATGLPAYLNRDSITVPPESVYSGSVRLGISGMPTAAAVGTALGVTVSRDRKSTRLNSSH